MEQIEKNKVIMVVLVWTHKMTTYTSMIPDQQNAGIICKTKTQIQRCGTVNAFISLST